MQILYTIHKLTLHFNRISNGLKTGLSRFQPGSNPPQTRLKPGSTPAQPLTWYKEFTIFDIRFTISHIGLSKLSSCFVAIGPWYYYSMLPCRMAFDILKTFSAGLN